MNKSAMLLLTMACAFVAPRAFAAYSFVQQAETSSMDSVASLSAPSITVSSSDLLIVVVLQGNATTTVSDGNGNTYATACVSPEAGGAYYLGVYYAENAKAGAMVVSANNTVYAVYVAEYSGISGSSAYVAGSCVINIQDSPGSGANVLTSGNSDVTSVPALFFGFTATWQNESASQTAGTSPIAFTGRTPVWATLTGNAAGATPEDTRITSTGSYAATFGVTSGQFDGFLTAAVAFAETSSGSCTHSGITSAGAIATPNGTSGSYVGKTGSFVTPDCASVNYWQPAQGNFGVN